MKMDNIEDIYPLSPMQQGMLFHTLYAPRSGLYIEQLSCALQGDLDVLALQQAWQRVLDRHPVLRTLFVWQDLDEPLQVVRQQVELPWEQRDWRKLSSVEQQEQLESFLRADREQGFELSRAPLVRLTLIQTAESTYQFIWTYHHLLLDGWSQALVLDQVFALYEAFHLKQEPASGLSKDLLLEPPRPYRDYIAWLQRQSLPRSKAFWQQVLQGFTTPTPVFTHQASGRLVRQGKHYDGQSLQISTATTCALRALAQQHGLTLNTLIQGAWALLLSRYSGETDLVFGVAVSGRPSALVGVESMVGLFINTLPARVQAPPEAWLLPWLKALQAQQNEARQYDYSPLVQIQEWSGMPRGIPLFESIVVFQNQPGGAFLQGQGSSLGIHDIRFTGKTNYPLALVAEPELQLWLQIIYDSSRFDSATINRLMGHFQMLLEGLVANPNRRLAELPLLTAAEQRRLLIEWNSTRTDYPREGCIHALFEEQVERTPDAIAIVFEDQQLTFATLNARANQLAHHLQRLGVGPEVLVGICMERCVEMIVGVLGTLKAGGAYAPLDPTYPQTRLAFMLEDTQLSILLTQGQLLTSFPEHRARIVHLDADWGAIVQESKANPGHIAVADNLAYVMYTSGSTGRPKGACIVHRSVVRLVKNTNYASLTAEEILLQFAPISFDASTFEIWGSLLTGARLVIFPPHTPSLEELGQALLQHHVTTLWLTAGLFHLMVGERLPDLKQVRQLLAGGDVLSVPHVQKVLRELGECQVINGYGPTENTTFTTCHPMTSDSPLGASVPIGRPIANTQVYVLDSHLRLLPIGVPGELYIGGDGLARGYLNRPDLTAERFIPHPVSNEIGSRLYRTGDLVRYRLDGSLEFLGRRDSQVKLRGFRIELKEIETVLRQHPAVWETVVLAREDGPGEKRLVAYVVGDSERTPTISELYRFLRDKLPEYMVPSSFVMLKALPLMPNGKVDRRVLPAPDQARPELGGAFVAPSTPVEAKLASIWAQVLGIEKVGVTDNFFELGGHSLLATRLFSRLRQVFQIELPLHLLFEAPTVAGLAKSIEAILRAAQDSQPPAEEEGYEEWKL